MFEGIWTPNGTAITNRYIALLDVLGFKHLLAARGLDRVFADYRGFQSYVRNSGNKFTVLGTLLGQTVGITKQAPYLLVSDGILLWCDEHGDLESFVGICASLQADSIKRGLPLRGAIAFGETIIDPATMTFLGQPIVDAHLTEKSQEWIGSAIHSSAAERLESYDDVAQYSVPVKPACPSLNYALKWHHYLHPSDTKKVLEEGKALADTIRQKLKNTADFVHAFPLEDA